MTPKTIVWLLILSGIFGFALQFFPTFDSGSPLLLVFAAMLVAMESSSRKFDEREEQLLFQAYSTTFRWSLFVLLIVYMFSELSAWLGILPGVTLFLNTHWLALTFSGLCLLLGIAGFKSFQELSDAASQSGSDI